MVYKVVFLNESLMWPVIGTALLVLSIFLWKEFAQAGKHRFILKGVLALIAIASLVLVVLRPAIPSASFGRTSVLLTPNFEVQLLDSIRKKDGRINVFKYEPGKSLSSVIKEAAEVVVLGQGVMEYDLWQLTEVPVSYLKTEIPGGLIKLHYKVANRLGDELTLQGIYKKPEEGNQLILQGPGGTGMDSLLLKADQEMKVVLKTPLKAVGKYVYTLVEKDAKGKIVNTDLIPVKVSEKKTLRILILNNSPTFETRYLKNYLAEAGHELLIKSRITSGRYKFEYFNTGEIPIDIITAQLLESFDLLMADAATIRSLTRSETNAISDEVRQKGLGLFIQPDNSFFNSSGNLYVLDFIGIEEGEITELEWAGEELSSFPYRIKKEFGVMEIHTSGNSLVAAYRGQGEGRIGTAVYFDTWQLMLNGKEEVYKELWSNLIERISKKEISLATWYSSQIMVQKNEPFEFELRTEISSPVVRTKSGSRIPLIQDRGLSYLWRGITWPRETGWNSLELDTISSHDFYVEENASLSAITAKNTMEANDRHFLEVKNRVGESVRLIPVNPLLFFGVFLLCIGGLWLEPKI